MNLSRILKAASVTGGILILLASGSTGAYYTTRIHTPPAAVHELRALEQELDDITLYDEFCRDPALPPTSSFTNYADLASSTYERVRTHPDVQRYKHDQRAAHQSFTLFTGTLCLFAVFSTPRKKEEPDRAAPSAT